MPVNEKRKPNSLLSLRFSSKTPTCWWHLHRGRLVTPTWTRWSPPGWRMWSRACCPPSAPGKGTWGYWKPACAQRPISCTPNLKIVFFFFKRRRRISTARVHPPWCRGARRSCGRWGGGRPPTWCRCRARRASSPRCTAWNRPWAQKASGTPPGHLKTCTQNGNSNEWLKKKKKKVKWIFSNVNNQLGLQ